MCCNFELQYVSFYNNMWQRKLNSFFFKCFLYYRSKEHESHKSPHLPGAAMGWHCSRLNYHSSSSETRGHPQNNRYGSEWGVWMWLNRLLRGQKKNEEVFFFMIENYSALPIIEVALHIFLGAMGISANITGQPTHKSYCIYSCKGLIEKLPGTGLFIMPSEWGR